MHLDEFLLVAVILLTATAIFVSLFKRLGMGSVLGFLAAGVLVGFVLFGAALAGRPEG